MMSNTYNEGKYQEERELNLINQDANGNVSSLRMKVKRLGRIQPIKFYT
jgi:hypothetical protein